MQAVQASMAIEGHQVSDEQARIWTEEHLASERPEKLAALRIDPGMSYEAMRAELRRVGLEG